KVFVLKSDVDAKHKFAERRFEAGEDIIMYGVLVGKTQTVIEEGEWINVFNVKHASADFTIGERNTDWEKPDTARFEGRTFMGYHRANGSVGTANYWIVLPLVFCENRNLEVMKDALTGQLGYAKTQKYHQQTGQLIE